MPRPPAPVTSTPALLTRGEIRATAVGHEAELRALRAPFLEGGPASALIVGEAGSGRSFLLARLALALAEEPELAARWTPLVLDGRAALSGLGEAALGALAELEETRGGAGQAETLRREAGAGASWEILRGWTRAEGRGLALLVDDLDAAGRALEEEGRGLGAAHGGGGLALVGTARRAIEEGPLAAVLKPVHVPPLADDEASELIARLATPRGAGAALESLSDPGRARTLLRLAGGNPGALVQLFEVLALGDASELRTVAERWLDRASPVYAIRLGALAEQAQRVVVGLARASDPASAAELSALVQLDVNAVSSQLSRLIKLGVVEKVDLPDSGRAGFQLVERRFNAWLRCRVSAAARQELGAGLAFLELYYGAVARDPRVLRRVPRAWEIGEASSSRPAWGALAGALDAPAPELGSRPPREGDGLGVDAAPGWARLGDLRKNVLKHYAEAEEAYQRALNLDPGLGWAWNNLGNLLRLTFLRADEAESAYRESLARDPTLSVAWLNLGNLLAELDRPEEAEEALRRALALDAGRAEAWASLGELLARIGRRGEALQALEEALARDASPPSLWRALAGLREEQGADGAAEQAWREAARRAPEDPLAALGLGRCQDRRGAATAAERSIRRALAFRPQSAEAWRALGDLVGGENRLAEAESAYRQAVAHAGEAGADGRLSLAWFLLATGRGADEAEGIAAELAARFPSAAGPAAVLAGARIRRGAFAEAVPLLRRLLEAERWPDHTFGVALGWFGDAAAAGHAADAAGLLCEAGLERAWRPLVEALRAAAGDPGRLRRLAPELAAPVAELLERLVPPPAVEEAPAQTPRRGRRPRRGW